MRTATLLLAIGLLSGCLGAAAQAAEPRPTVDAIEAQLKAKQYAEAAEAALKHLSSLEKRGLGDSLESARVLDVLVEANWRGTLADPKDLSYGERAVAIREKLLGPDDPSVATSLHLLANLALARGNAAAAKVHYERSLAIREKVFGPESPEVVPSLNNLGNVTRTLGDLESSRRVLERALAIREKTLPPTSRDLVRSHVSLGNTLGELGLLSEAEAHLRKAVGILDAQEARDPQIASALNTLSNVLDRQGRYEEAEATVRRAIALMRESGGRAADLAMFQGNLAVLRRDRGDLADARTLQEEALRIEAASGSTDPLQRAFLLNNLGHLFLLMGDPAGARPILEQALELRRKVLPADHPLIAESLQNLGHVHLARRELDEARRDYEQALGILERTVGPHHRNFGEALVDLGTACQAQGKHQEARALFTRALDIFGNTVGPESLLTVRARIHLADAEQSLGEGAAARTGYEGTLAIVRRAFGSSHQVVAEILSRLSYSLALAGEEARALDTAIEAESIRVDIARSAIPVLPYRQALALASAPAGLNVAMSLATRTQKSEVVRRTWEALIQSRGLTIDEMVRRALPSDSSDDARTKSASDLEVARNRVVQLLVKGDSPAVLDAARREAERLEQALAAATASERDHASAETRLAEIGAQLPTGTALLAYAHFRDVLAPASRSTKSDAYAAFVIAHGRPAPEIVPLGPAAEIDRLVAKWRHEVTSPAVAGVRKGGEATYDAAALALGKAIWEPVRARLGGMKTVLLVPDGALQLVSFPSLRGPRARYLAESGPRIHLLTAERDVLRPPRASTGRGLLTLAAPQFDGAQVVAEASTKTDRVDLARLRSALERGGAARFVPLPGSRDEAARVASLWGRSAAKDEGAVGMRGAEASEEAFKAQAPGKRILHLATHGFFLAPEGGGPAEDYGSKALDRWTGSGSAYLSADSPLRMAGLALAGANQGLAGNAPTGEDGLLLAEEVASIDLRGVEWVVLSACETGVGDLVPGEGIVGLRRAALTAGARSVIMSLWRVQDEATAQWMGELYAARLEKRDSTVAALHHANRAVLASRRRAGKSTHPFYWAAFVAAGDWR